MSSSLFLNERRFEENVEKARKITAKILVGERGAVSPMNTEHTYSDKYQLAELTVRTGILNQLRYFQDLLNFKDDDTVRKWISQGKSVTFRFDSTEECEFSHEKKREVENSTRVETTTLFGLGSKKIETRKVITTMTDYFWNFKSTWSLVAYAGSDPKKNVIELSKRSYEKVIKKTDVKTAPKPKLYVRTPIEVNVTWFLKQYDTKREGYTFYIDRSNVKTCHTPRRNEDVKQALAHFFDIMNWSKRIETYFKNTSNFFQEKTFALQESDTFRAVSAIFAFDKDTKKVFEGKDLISFDNELKRSLLEHLENNAKVLPSEKEKNACYTTQEGMICFASQLLCINFQCISDNVNMIEEMLRRYVCHIFSTSHLVHFYHHPVTTSPFCNSDKSLQPSERLLPQKILQNIWSITRVKFTSHLQHLVRSHMLYDVEIVFPKVKSQSRI